MHVRLILHQVLDKFIRTAGSSEGGGYFLGGRYSFAETVTTPFLRRALLVLPHYRGFDPRKSIQAKGLNRLDQWIEVSWLSTYHICS